MHSHVSEPEGAQALTPKSHSLPHLLLCQDSPHSMSTRKRKALTSSKNSMGSNVVKIKSNSVPDPLSSSASNVDERKKILVSDDCVFVVEMGNKIYRLDQCSHYGIFSSFFCFFLHSV